MTRRYGFIVSILLAMLVSLPAFSLIDGTGGSASPPSRYGFTLSFKEVANPTSECLCVAIGDIDGTNNDDLAIGMQDQIMVLKNLGGAGNFNLYKTIPLTGKYVTDMEMVDYDADSDVDIIALGQDYYYMANDLSAELGPSVGVLTVYYLENVGTGFNVETSIDIQNVFYNNRNWLFFDGKLDLTTGDFNDDGDIDAAVIYPADTNGNSANVEALRIDMVSYSTSGLTSSTIHTEAPDFASARVVMGFLKAADMDEDGFTDLVFVSFGSPMDIQIMWNTAGTLDTPITAASIEVTGSFNPPIPFSLDLASIGGAKWLDIMVGTSMDDDGYSRDGQVWVIRQKPGDPHNTFGTPEQTYSIQDSQYNDEYAFRGFAVGRINNSADNHIDDVVTFNKVDSDDDGAIDAFTLSALKSQTLSPKCLAEMKFYVPGEINTGHLNAIALGNLDGDSQGYDDLVYVGDNVEVGLVSWPDDISPTKQTVVQSPSPVLNDGKQEAIINITIQDLDGAWDLFKAEIDFTGIPGMVLEGQTTRIITVERPTWEDPNDHSIGSFLFTIKVPPEVVQGDYTVPIRIYGMMDHDIVLPTDFQFRVKQFNRAPIFNISAPEVIINEDEEITFTGIYDWFMDQDGNEMEIKMKNPKVQGSYLTVLDNEMFRATMNMTGSDYRTLTLTVTPKPNKHHNADGSGGSNIIKLQAFDYELESEDVELYVMINSVNDMARIPAETNNNYEFALKQDDPGFTSIHGTDPYDDDAEGRYLRYAFNYTDPADEAWLTIEPEGKVLWNPKNPQVGPHKVLLVVNDSYDNFTIPFWFNVSNVIDHPYLVSVQNATTTIDLVKNPVKGRLEFVVYEHETFSLTVKVDDKDKEIGLQTGVNFHCNLTLSGNTTLLTNEDNFSATLTFEAEQRYGYFATVGEHKAIETEILIVDPEDPDSALSLPLKIVILNINDRPLPVTIDSPLEGSDFPILYNHLFSAGSGMDPDTIYGDNLTYAWDFDASDGFTNQTVGASVTWDFPAAGSYKVTLRLIDGGGLYTEAFVNVTAHGLRNDSDYDNDGIPNVKELEFGLNPYNPEDSLLDKDGDHLTNLEEYLNGTDLNVLDSDRDGVADDTDYAPLDNKVWEKPVKEEQWTDDPINIMLLVLVVAIIVILLITIATLYIIRSRKKASEEEEKRRLAEEMQKSMYEDQDLYKDLPSLQKQGQLAEVQAPTLPPAPAGLDDIFGGAGVLPSGPAATPPGPKPPVQEGKSDDLTDLLG